MIIFECDTEMQECPRVEHMQMQLTGPSKRLVSVLLSVSVTKLVSDAPYNIPLKPVATGYMTPNKDMLVYNESQSCYPLPSKNSIARVN